MNVGLAVEAMNASSDSTSPDVWYDTASTASAAESNTCSEYASSSQLDLSYSASDVDSEGPLETYLYEPLESDSCSELEGAQSEDDDSTLNPGL